MTLASNKKPSIYNEFTAFGLKWQLSKSSNTWYAQPSDAFYALWHKQKAKLKEQGYWLSNCTGKWQVYYKEARHDQEVADHKKKYYRRSKKDPYWKKIF